MRSLNILVAEDDDQNQAMLKLILTRRGHRVKSAWNGLQALNAVKTESFDVVFMDIQMPEMGGLEATRQIRAWENKKQHVPIVILSGSVPPAISETYKLAGADTFLGKPFDMIRLDLLINVIASEEQIPYQKVAMYEMDEPLAELVVMDDLDALARFDGDVEMFHANLSEFIKGIPDRLDRLKQALVAEQWEDVSLQAHNFKGVSANFGAIVLSVLAYRLDEYSHQHKSSQALQTFEIISQHLPVLIEAAKKIMPQSKL